MSKNIKICFFIWSFKKDCGLWEECTFEDCLGILWIIGFNSKSLILIMQIKLNSIIIIGLSS